MADGERGASPRQFAIHTRVPRRHARRDDPAAAARPPAERSRQLLREPRTGSRRHAPRPGEGAHRHRQLPRLPAPRDARAVRRRARAAAGARRAAPHPRDGRTGAAARDARVDGPETGPGAERRGAPLLPREAGRVGRGRAQGGRSERGEEEHREGPHLDLRAGGGAAQARGFSGSSTCRRRRSSCGGRATPKAPCSRGRPATSR